MPMFSTALKFSCLSTEIVMNNHHHKKLVKTPHKFRSFFSNKAVNADSLT